MILVNNIEKKYGDLIALNKTSFEIQKGEIFGLIGPDGAGKTTLIRILTTLILPDSGSAEIMGYDVVNDFKKLRSRIGYMPGRFSLYMDLTVEENLQLFASIFGTTIEKNYELIRDIYEQIEPFKKRRAGDLSGGMKQKLALSCAMIHKPEVIFLDEPTTGVDAVSRKEFWQMLKKLKTHGITILVSTPYMDEAGMCDRVALIQNGSIFSIAPPDQIVKEFGRPLYRIQASKKSTLVQDLRNYTFARSVFIFGDSIHYTDKKQTADINSIHQYLADKKYEGIKIEQIEPSIEDCFMELMK